MKNILVGYDNSRWALIALEQAIGLASGLHARLHLLQAMEPVGPASEVADVAPSEDPLSYMDRMDAMMTEDDTPPLRDEDLAAAVRMCEEAGVHCVQHKQSGLAVRVLREYSPAMDLVVLGRRGTIGRRLVGSTASSVISRPIVPTLLCRDEQVAWRRLLLVFENSVTGGRAVKVAGTLASELNLGLDVVIADSDRERGRRTGEQAKMALRAYHVEGEFIYHEGRVAEALQSAALQLQSSVVIVPQGRTCAWPWSRSEAVRAAIEFPTALALVVP